MTLPYLRPLAAVAVVGIAAAGVLVAQPPRNPQPPPPVTYPPANPQGNLQGQPPAGMQMPPRVKAILVDRAQTLRGIADRTAELAKLPADQKPAGPEEVFAARQAAGHAEIDVADTDAQRRAILIRLLADTVTYEKLVADSIRANPAPANDVRGRVDRENAMAQLKLGRLDLELAIERMNAGMR